MARAFSSEVETGSRKENASKQESRAPFRFNRNGKGSRHWIWKATIAGFCGSAAHSLLMYLKWRTGLLPDFEPYDNLQAALGHLTGSKVHPVIPWALSFLNGSTILGLCFGWFYAKLPGESGLAKGVVFGILGWVLMGFVFFPLLGLGLFATNVDRGAWPALFSLAMLLTYSVILGIVYAHLDPRGETESPRFPPK